MAITCLVAWRFSRPVVRIAQLARRIEQGDEDTDFVARYGGEEFLILLPNTDGNGGPVLAEKIRRAVASQGMPPAGQVTLSIGLAVVNPEEVNDDVVVRRADAALYRAKAAGRNRVIEADLRPSPAE